MQQTSAFSLDHRHANLETNLLNARIEGYFKNEVISRKNDESLPRSKITYFYYRGIRASCIMTLPIANTRFRTATR